MIFYISLIIGTILRLQLSQLKKKVMRDIQNVEVIMHIKYW